MTYSAFRLYIFYQYVCSLRTEPTTFCAANAMLYHWATGTLTRWTYKKVNTNQIYNESSDPLALVFISCTAGRLWSTAILPYLYCRQRKIETLLQRRRIQGTSSGLKKAFIHILIISINIKNAYNSAYWCISAREKYKHNYTEIRIVVYN